jgi:DNA invertase Pin-like site-specific DNA recombinase
LDGQNPKHVLASQPVTGKATQQFKTAHSMGRLTLNILLSFAQFERELISERTRDKMAAARRKGKWLGGVPVLGYGVDRRARRLIVLPEEADQVVAIYELYRSGGVQAAMSSQKTLEIRRIRRTPAQLFLAAASIARYSPPDRGRADDHRFAVQSVR